MKIRFLGIISFGVAANITSVYPASAQDWETILHCTTTEEGGQVAFATSSDLGGALLKISATSLYRWIASSASWKDDCAGNCTISRSDRYIVITTRSDESRSNLSIDRSDGTYQFRSNFFGGQSGRCVIATDPLASTAAPQF